VRARNLLGEAYLGPTQEMNQSFNNQADSLAQLTAEMSVMSQTAAALRYVLARVESCAYLTVFVKFTVRVRTKGTDASEGGAKPHRRSAGPNVRVHYSSEASLIHLQ
jgi:hypothetical protein